MSVYTNLASRSAQQATAYTTAILELLGDRELLSVLQGTVLAIGNQIDGLSADELNRVESDGTWSIRHVLQQLSDSELVWSVRLRMVIAHDRPPLTGYDQDRWAERLKYDQAHALQAPSEFAVLRQANLRLLVGLSHEERQRVGIHAERGEESIEHMIRLYAGHDLAHLRQIDRIRHAL